jgi:hypothetical protein
MGQQDNDPHQNRLKAAASMRPEGLGQARPALEVLTLNSPVSGCPHPWGGINEGGKPHAETGMQRMKSSNLCLTDVAHLSVTCLSA